MFVRCLPLALALTLALVPTAALAEWRACRVNGVARPAPLRGEPATAPDNALNCRHGTSLRVGDATLWRCQIVPPDDADLPEGTPPYAFLIDRPGMERQVLPDDLMAGRFDAFEVTTVDLDGDGRAERVLAAWNSQGNGLGVHRWTIRVFDADWRLVGQLDEVADWGPSSVVRAPRGRRGCDIAATDFVESVNRRGVAGVSLQARFHRLAAGRLEAATDRPVVQRRYDFAFQRQRTAHFDRRPDGLHGDPGTWLARAMAVPQPRD
jgi:hypothetical protein